MFPVLKNDESGTSRECSDAEARQCSDVGPVQSVVMWDLHRV
jgi:hypothetical protein